MSPVLGAEGSEEVDRERCEREEECGADQWRSGFWERHGIV
jgi:hypothetical protein